MKSTDYIIMVLCMGGVTYIPRMLPLMILSDRKLPDWFAEWLELIPAAILSALIVPSLFTLSSPRVFDLSKPELFAAIPTLLFALRTRSLAGTVIVGMFSYWGITAIIR